MVSATREVASLQELGSTVYASGDINRAYLYLSSALENAVECGAPLRMIESSRALPIIERAHNSNMAKSRRIIYIILVAMSVLLKFFWYDHLKDVDREFSDSEPRCVE